MAPLPLRPFRGGRAARPGRRAVVAALVAVGLLVAAGGASAITLPPGFEDVPVATGLTVATAIDWAPDGRLFIAEKAGVVKVVDRDGEPPKILLDISAHVNDAGERGLLGLAVDTAFESNGYLYLLYVYENDPLHYMGPKVARLTRVTVTPDNTVENPESPETVLVGTEGTPPCPPPSNMSDCMPADDPLHTVGTVRSDPRDGTLWAGLGDSLWPTDPGTHDSTRAFRPLDERSYSGKIIHVNRAGRGLPDHPFCPADTDLTHVCTKVYAKGFRNPFRFTLRPSGGPVVGDVGWIHYEEINATAPGRNYGWPCYEGSIRPPGYRDTSECKAEYAKEATPEGAVSPVYEYRIYNWEPGGERGAAVIAGPSYRGTDYPAGFRDSLFIADYVRGWIKTVTFDSVGNATAVPFAGSIPEMVDLEAAPNGDLVYVKIGFDGPGTGAVRRIRYAPGNRTPTAVLAADPRWGKLPLHVSFSGSSSSDPDGDSLTYSWDFGDGSAPSAEADPTHTYARSGNYVVQLTVADGRGLTSSERVIISAGNTPPDVSILSPASGTRYRGGQTVMLRASAVDEEDGPLPDSAISWQVILHHGEHRHQLGTFAGKDSAINVGDDHDADSYLEVRVTAMDSRGLTDSGVVDLRPETVEIRLETSPIEATVRYGGREQVAPFVVTAAVGFRAPISAVESVHHEGRTYLFVGWSNGGFRTHDLVIPPDPTTLVALYATSPVNDDVPTIRGTVRAGKRLVAYSGSWSGTSPLSYTYQWLRCDALGGACEDIPGATSATYALAMADVRRTIRVRVTAMNSAGSASEESPATLRVEPPASARLWISSVPVRATSRGLVRVRARCTGEIGCKGRVTLRTTKRLRYGRKIRLASKSVIVRRDARTVLPFRLSAKNKRLLERLRKVDVTATAVMRDALGNAAITKRRFLLRPPSP